MIDVTQGQVQAWAQGLLALAAVVLLGYYWDRLRVLQWRTHLWRVVGMHLAWAVWLGWLVFRALMAGDVDLYHVFGVIGAAMWLVVSAPTWRSGPPEHTQTAPAPLVDEPEPVPAHSVPPGGVR